MEHFLDTVRTIGSGLGFQLYDEVHLAWLCLTVLSVVVGCLHYHRLSEHHREIWRKVIALLLIFNEVFKQVCLQLGGNFTINYLPLHLCNINIFLIAWHAWRPNETLGNFLYTICVPATVAALLFPTWEKLPVLNFMHLHSFTIHILLALYPLVLTVNGDIKPNLKAVPKCLGLLAAMAGGIYCVNLALGTNYFYLMNAPKGNPLYWFQANWGNHLLGIPVLIVAVLAVMYLPVELYHRRKQQHIKFSLKSRPPA